MKSLKYAIMVLVLVSALIAPITSPRSVRADGEVTPATTESPKATETPDPGEAAPTETAAETPTDVVSTEKPTEPPTEPLQTETPAVSDSPTPDPAITETPVPPEVTELSAEAETLPADDEPESATEAPQIETPVSKPTEEVAPDITEEPTLLEVVAEIPAETSVVVLDEEGDVLPLALQAAADVVAESDPVWCPAGQTPGGVGCSGSFSTVTQLISSIGSVSNGTIYFTAAPTYSTNDMTFFFASNLTIQGGWNGSTGKDYDIIGNTTFTVPIQLIFADGDIHINNVTVNGAAGVGVALLGSANLNVDNSTITGTTAGGSASYTWGDGMDVFTSGNVTITDSTISNNNYDGIFGNAHSYTFRNSTFTGNGQNGYGAGLNISTGSTVTFGYPGTDFDNSVVDISIICPNGYLGLDFDDGVITTLENTTIDSDCVATVQLPGKETTQGSKTGSTNQVYVPASASKVSFYLDCSRAQRTFTINLPNGDKVEIVCPVDGKASITRMDNTTLPGPLPDGFTFASAFQLEILQVIQPPEREGNDFKRWSIPFIETGGHVKVSFVAPSPEVGNNYSILYWDNGSWVTLKDFMMDTNSLPQSFSLDPGADPPDKRIILSGVEFVNRGEDSRVEVSTNFPGIFVLAQR